MNFMIMYDMRRLRCEGTFRTDQSQRSPNVGDQIRTATNNNLTTVFDTVSTEATATICANAIGPDGGKYCNLLGVDCPRPDVESTFFLGYSMSGESYISEGETYEAQPEDFTFATKWYDLAERLWAEGKWQPHPQSVRSGGLLGAVDGMQEMREGRISGVKLVYRVDETTWPED